MSIIRFEDGYYGQVLIGNTATYLGKQSEPTKTHRWTCFVKGRRAVRCVCEIEKDLFAAQLLRAPLRSQASPMQTSTSGSVPSSLNCIRALPSRGEVRLCDFFAPTFDARNRDRDTDRDASH